MSNTILSEHTFPHAVRWMEEEITLYAEPDRRTVRYSVLDRESGKPSPKLRVPRELGVDAMRPSEPCGYRKGKLGREVPVFSVPELLIEWARGRCQQLADERRGIHAEIAAMQNQVNHVKVGYVFARVRETTWYRELKPARLDEVGRVMRWVEAELGSDYILGAWDSDVQAGLFSRRRHVGVKSTTTDGGPTFLPACGRNTATKDLRTLKTIFKQARTLKYRPGSVRDLVDTSPMERFDLPRYGARRKRELVDHSLYETLLRYTDEVDPTGRFRLFLVLLRWTGERVSTILRLQVGSLLFTPSEIERAFGEQLCNYIAKPSVRRKAADLYARTGGAVFFRLGMRKPGQSGDEGEVEQYDAVVPLNPAVKPEFERYRDGFIEVRQLGPEAPLFPGDRLDHAVSEGQVNNWWHAAVRLAERRERCEIALSKGNAYHGLRYNRRTELRKVETKYARFLVGHSITKGTPGIEVSEGVYLGIKPRDLVEAVLLSDDGEEDEDW
jgi:hypothetical protein